MSDMPSLGQPAILFAEECDRGTLRPDNQDSVLHVRIAMGELMIVADGIGGYTGGATASRMVVEHFYAHLASLPADYPAESAIREAAARANTAVLAAAIAPDSPNRRMGSTVVVALLQQEGDATNAWIGHVGDSRAYLWRVGRLHRLTNDHSAVQSMLDRSLITPEEAEHHPDASVLTRSLGHQTTVEIDIEQHPLAVGDTLLLCSDGLWGFVPEQEIEKAAAGVTVQGAAHQLLELALATGGHDNIGIEIARIIQPPAVHPPRNEQAGRLLTSILTIFLLAVAGLLLLVYFVLFR